MTLRRLIVAAAFAVVLTAPQVTMALTTEVDFSGCHGFAQNPGITGGSVFARVYNGGLTCEGDPGVEMMLELQQKKNGNWIGVKYGLWVSMPDAGFNNLAAIYQDCGPTSPDKNYRTRVWALDQDGYQGSGWVGALPIAASSVVQWPVDCLTYMGQ